ncbi:hypothetical protein ACLB2K_031343 [Fragaria x ananassa]
MALQKGFAHVNINTWLVVLPQIIARIHSNNHAVRELIQSLLVRIGQSHPQVGYLLGLGDRHPSNLILHRYSGKILHIDFGDCFEASMNREKFPEKFLFIKFGVCQPAVPPQEQPNDDDHDDGGIDSIDTS